MRFVPILLILITILTACAPVVPDQANPPPAPAPDTASETHPVVLDGTFRTSLLAIVWKGKLEGNLLFPVDPASGNALPGYKPIPLDFSTSHAFSPDRRKLAVMSFPTEATRHGTLVLIDLPTWRTDRLDLDLSGWVSHIVFSPDGKRLAIVHGDSDYRLTLFDLTKGVIVAQTESDSYISLLKFTESGEELMLYNQAVNSSNGQSAGPPEVQLLDGVDLHSLWSAQLAQVRDGIFLKDEEDTTADIYEPGQIWYISTGRAFAPDRNALYVVHADSEKLTTVNFEGKMVETVAIQTKLTWFEKLLSLTAGVAHAKIGDGIIRQAAVSPDGQFLYVVGVNSATSPDQHGNWQIEQTPRGLEIIQTSDGSRVERFESDATEMSLSPDGRFLYLRHWEKEAPSTEVFDISGQQVIARKLKIFALPALLMNGEFLLTSTYSTSDTSHHMSVLQPDGSSLLAEWTSSESIWWLSAPQ